jgi:hypothetical protein
MQTTNFFNLQNETQIRPHFLLDFPHGLRLRECERSVVTLHHQPQRACKFGKGASRRLSPKQTQADISIRITEPCRENGNIVKKGHGP